jgi:hypothetical protein
VVPLLVPGDDWDQAIAQAQAESAVSLVLVSAKTEKTYYQREEIAAAIDMAVMIKIRGGSCRSKLAVMRWLQRRNRVNTDDLYRPLINDFNWALMIGGTTPLECSARRRRLQAIFPQVAKVGHGVHKGDRLPKRA